MHVCQEGGWFLREWLFIIIMMMMMGMGKGEHCLDTGRCYDLHWFHRVIGFEDGTGSDSMDTGYGMRDAGRGGFPLAYVQVLGIRVYA